MPVVEVIDGPFGHATMRGLSRVPLLLRVVRDAGGKLDALDALDDEPRAGERVEVFRQVSRVFACSRRGGSDPEFARYAHVPVDELELARVRDTSEWRAWCEREGPRLFPGAQWERAGMTEDA